MENPLIPQITQFLLPALPYLVKGVKLAGQEAAKKLGETYGEKAAETAEALWARLRARPQIAQVAQTAASLPDNEDLQKTALLEEIKKALQSDPALLAEASRLFSALPKPAGNIVSASGERSVAVGGNLSGSTIITGNNNQVTR